MIAHDDVNHGAMIRKILKKIIDLAPQVELIPMTLNLLRNSAIQFHICSCFVTYLLYITSSTLGQSKFHILSLFTN